MSETLPSFGPLEVHHSEESWGPLNLPDRFEGMPYAPYCKSDRLGKAADFTMAYPRPCACAPGPDGPCAARIDA